jgi:hypothetical protein
MDAGGREPPGMAAASSETDLGGGWRRQRNGLLHRVLNDQQCASQLPRPDPLPFAGADSHPPDGGVPRCDQDSDCRSTLHGHCELSKYYRGLTVCVPGCVADSECAPGSVCLCGDPVGHCQNADCLTDADCPRGLLCASFENGCGQTLFACQTIQDECVTAADCASECVPGVGGRRACAPPPSCPPLSGLGL